MVSKVDPMESTKIAAHAFNQQLTAIRAHVSPANGCPWYPWGSLGNVWWADQLLAGEHRNLFGDLEGKIIADIACADGDMGLFLASRGAHVDLIDNPATNINGFVGARTLASELALTVNIQPVDLDRQFQLPRDHYDLILFLGILYHLKNPFFALEHLARYARHVFLSTRIARFAPGDGIELAAAPVAYLVDRLECNNDPSNYWIFSLPGLLRLCERSGWKVAECKTFGDTTASNPADNDHDERAYLLLEHLPLI